MDPWRATEHTPTSLLPSGSCGQVSTTRHRCDSGQFPCCGTWSATKLRRRLSLLPTPFPSVWLRSRGVQRLGVSHIVAEVTPHVVLESSFQTNCDSKFQRLQLESRQLEKIVILPLRFAPRRRTRPGVHSIDATAENGGRRITQSGPKTTP